MICFVFDYGIVLFIYMCFRFDLLLVLLFRWLLLLLFILVSWLICIGLAGCFNGLLVGGLVF